MNAIKIILKDLVVIGFPFEILRQLFVTDVCKKVIVTFPEFIAFLTALLISLLIFSSYRLYKLSKSPSPAAESISDDKRRRSL